MYFNVTCDDSVYSSGTQNSFDSYVFAMFTSFNAHILKTYYTHLILIKYLVIITNIKYSNVKIVI